MCPQERLVLISISTGLSFAKKGLGHLLRLFVVFITCTLFCCFIRKPLKIRLLSIYRDFLLRTTSQHLLILVGIDTPIYRKYYDTPPILVGHQRHVARLVQHARLPRLEGAAAEAIRRGRVVGVPFAHGLRERRTQSSPELGSCGGGEVEQRRR